MAANWRRCQKCRKVLPVEDFDGNSDICRSDAAKAAAAASRTAPPRVTTTVIATRSRPTATPVRDIRGHGDPEVRARRARTRALERLSRLHPDDFAELLREERASEGL
jgi:hypothetical protein